MRGLGWHRQITARRLIVTLWLACVVLLAGLLIYTSWVTPLPAAQPLPAIGSPAPPTGRRWFWERPLWQQPESPVP